MLNLLTKRAKVFHLGPANYCWFIDPCDVKTLAREGGVDRTAFYGTRPYAHLRVEFERRLQALQQA
ncbi:hypothetical protein [Streptomyces laculatispora]|uniref:hypothetical protein n=1 Tax=Streptomyces laculatispora TaxID=887464 RepID=UPI001A94B079|nr:hypothetical protein [Streptomyces laculatispora]MBO0912773.1 hypothetical protein [Streptomyces laculatispora]